MADRQRRVLVGAVRKSFVDKDVPRDGGHGVENAFVGDARLAQAAHEAIARTPRGHADPLQVEVLHGVCASGGSTTT